MGFIDKVSYIFVIFNPRNESSRRYCFIGFQQIINELKIFQISHLRSENKIVKKKTKHVGLKHFFLIPVEKFKEEKIDTVLSCDYFSLNLLNQP